MTAIESKPAPIKLRNELVTELRRQFDSGPVIARDDGDTNLVILGDQTGALARSLNHPGTVAMRLRCIAAFAMAWGVEKFGGAENPFSVAWMMVREERQRQRLLFRRQSISFDCGSPVVNPRRKYRVLLEEVGEVAEALDRIERVGNFANYQHLQTELIQVATVAVAWLESLEAA